MQLSEEQKENRAAYMRKWNREHPEKAREMHTNYRMKYPEKVREQQKRRYWENRENWLEKKREWKTKNREHVNEYQIRFRETHRDLVNGYSKANKAKRRGVRAEVFAPREIYERDMWICQLCRKKVSQNLKWPHPYSPSIDHIIPISLGGEHTKMNTQLAHLTCNRAIGVSGIKQTRLF